jgi:multiple sugar transport system substrate-binding protein
MKSLFATLAVLLILASLALWSSYPDQATDVPILRWVTGPNPIRYRQIDLFHEWLVEHKIGQTVELQDAGDVERLQGMAIPEPLIVAMRNVDPIARQVWSDELEPRPLPADAFPAAVTVPAALLKLDTGNQGVPHKKIIQSVSGVAGDMMDMLGNEVTFFNDMGVLADLTEAGLELGFDPTTTWPAIAPSLTVEGRQFAYPCNVSPTMFWVNRGLFESLELQPPPDRWTVEEFERIGKRFVEAANAPGERQTVFFTTDISLSQLFRSMGLSIYNETLTASTLDDPRFARSLELKRKWIEEDHLLPNSAERDSFETESGYGGANMQLFNRGHFGLMPSGRFAMIQLRRFNDEHAQAGRPPLRLGVVEPPHAGLPITLVIARCSTVYIDGRPDLAKYFMAYLASDVYNEEVVRASDSLPPNPAMTQTEAYLRPPDRPNEWGIHGPFAEAARAIAVPEPISPFVTPSEAGRHLREVEDVFLEGQIDAQAAGRRVAQRVNDAIRFTLSQDDAARVEHERRARVQAQIDARRAEGRPVPLEWIDNPYHRDYYAKQGWLE